MKIVREPHPQLPDRFSKELKDLIDAMLRKDDRGRPTTREILDLPFAEKYMIDFIKEKTKTTAFEQEAVSTAAAAQEERLGLRPLTAKEKMQRRKEEKAKKEFEMMKNAAKVAKQNYAA